jgi:hypothetical protein|tara:strand:+ start:1237 stop:1419 length:183 start_codon:yes stop_codon:yes gene_type:complete
MKIDLSEFDDLEQECDDRWHRRERKVNNRSKLKEPTDSRPRKKNKEKPLTKTKEQSIIRE